MRGPPFKNPGMTCLTSRVAVLACASTVLFHAAWAQDAPASATRPAASPPARVLVLGTAHLATLKKPWEVATLEPVISRLVAFHPDVVAVENLSGLACDAVARSPTKYDPEDFRRYCFDTSQAFAATGLDVPTAAARLVAALRTWPAAPSPMQRRHLVALALAAGEPATARLQWAALDPAERRAEDGLSAGLVELLDRRRNGEVDLLATPVAARSGLARLLAMDDHTGDNNDVADPEAFGRALAQAWGGGEKSVQTFQAREAAFEGALDALGLYRYLNDPASIRPVADVELGTATRDPSPQHYGRMWVTGWETRNLRMAANIAEAIRDAPDARVLVIVGAEHKPWLERFLGQLAHVEIVDAQAILR